MKETNEAEPITSATVSFDGLGDEHVHLAGKEISGALTGVDVQIRVGEIPQLTLHLLVTKISCTLTEAVGLEVMLPKEAEELLTQLGWAPPPAGPGG